MSLFGKVAKSILFGYNAFADSNGHRPVITGSREDGCKTILTITADSGVEASRAMDGYTVAGNGYVEIVKVGPRTFEAHWHETEQKGKSNE